MKLIPLTKGKFAKVDDEDFEEMMKYSWYAGLCNKGKGYAMNTKYLSCVDGKYKYRRVSMHRLIIGAIQGQVVDHKDGDTLNNQKSNLRICTYSQNSTNRTKSRGKTSKYLGVVLVKGRWRPSICKEGKREWLGGFDTENEAADAYNVAAIRLHGEFATLNIIQ